MNTKETHTETDSLNNYFPNKPPMSRINSYQISFIPLSWAIGIWNRRHKTTLSIGPFRLSISRNLRGWKEPGGR